MTSISEILESYKTFLAVKYPLHHRKFCKLVKQNLQGANAEAVLFRMMRSTFDEVLIGEDISTGGPDFLCVSGENNIVLEVTSLEAEAVAMQSGWPDNMPEDVTSGTYKMIAHIIQRKAKRKIRQISGKSMPGVLAITCEHDASEVLLGPRAVVNLLTGYTKISVPVGQVIEEMRLTTGLNESVFIKMENGKIEPVRKSISAVLLVSIYPDRLLIFGALHPDPVVVFPSRLLPSVPFCRITRWPLEDEYIETEWVIGEPNPAVYYHKEVKLRNDELRNK